MSNRDNLAAINAELASIEAQLDVIYKAKISEYESKVVQPYAPDMQHQDKVVQKGMGGAEAAEKARQWMANNEPAKSLLEAKNSLEASKARLVSSAGWQSVWGRR